MKHIAKLFTFTLVLGIPVAASAVPAWQPASQAQIEQWNAIANDALKRGDLNTAIINYRRMRTQVSDACLAMRFAASELAAIETKASRPSNPLDFFARRSLELNQAILCQGDL
jgi:hypothetical protein